MAKKFDNGSDGGTLSDPKHNVKAREQQIKEGLEEMYQADCRIAASIEKHVKPDRDVKSDIKKKIREGLNITTQLFNARYSNYRLERQAMEASDDATLDVLKELYDIAPVGTQINLLDAIDGEQPTA